MEKLNKNLKQKLDSLPDDVKKLASEALSNAERLPDAPLSQYLEQVVRKIVRDSDEKTIAEGDKA